MAKVERKDYRVRKRPATSYVWEEVKVDQDVFRKEYVQTGEGSTAIVKFSNGKVIELKENSLIIVDDSDDLSLNFLKGTGVLKGVGKDAQITKNAQGQTQILEFKAKLLAPLNLSNMVVVGSTGKIEHQWSTAMPLKDSATLEVSKTPDFSSAKTQKIPIQGKNTALAAYSTGRYYWRLVEDQKPISDVNEFKIVEAPSIKAVFPSDNQSIKVLSEQTISQFRWSINGSLPENTSHRTWIEISNSADFKNPIRKDVDLKFGFTKIFGIKNGKYFWRIHSEIAGTAINSPTTPFSVEQISRIQIDLLQPEDGLALQKQKLPRFSWKTDLQSEEIRYELELKELVANQKTIKHETRDPGFVLPRIESGTYHWKVSAFIGNQKIGETSSRKISFFDESPLRLKKPAADQKFEYWDTRPELAFEWESDALTSKGYEYQLEISDSKDFKNVVYSKKLDREMIDGVDLPAQGSQFFWRVNLIDSNGLVAKASAIQAFSMAVFSAPEAPKTAGLETGGEVFKVQETDADPVLVWSPVNHARRYELLVYRIAPGKSPELILTEETDANRFKLSKLGEGEYQFTIRGIDSLKRKGQAMAYKKFKVDFGDLLPPPESLTEEVQ